MRVLTPMKRWMVVAAMSFALFLTARPLGAAVTEVIAVGTMEYAELFAGPANMTMRRLRIAPGEVLGWHYHPGVGAFTIVKRGTLTVEDGCGGVEVYTTGQAFIEHTDRVHRGKNLGAEEVETLQMFFVPLGTPISVSTSQLCGAPQDVQECLDDRWTTFTHPYRFSSRGECIQYVKDERADECRNAQQRGVLERPIQ